MVKVLFLLPYFLPILLESKIHYLVYKLKIKKFTLHVHPFVAAYVNQGVFSLKMKWRCKYTFQLKVIPNQSLAYLEYKFYDAERNEIDLKEEKLKLKNERVLSQFIEAPKGLYFFESAKEKLFF